MPKILPAILTDSMTTLIEQLSAVQDAPQLEAVHIDIIDGMYVDNVTVTPLDLTTVEFGDTKIDLHLMTDEPMDAVYEAEAVREYLPIRQVIGQIERMSHQGDFIWEVKKNNWEPVLGLNIFTPIEEIDDRIWNELDGVLLMSVEAGHQHGMFNRHVFEKITELRAKPRSGPPLKITLDGGIKLNNFAEILTANVQEVTAGSSLWDSTDPAETFAEFNRLSSPAQG